MDSASPTLTRCIEICLAYLGFGAATPKRVTYETANYVAAEGSVGIQQNPDVPLRTSGAASVQAGSTVPVLWTRKNLAPGHRGVGPAKILKHEAARAQATAPLPPRPLGAGVEEILWWNPHGPLAYNDPRQAESAFWYRNADQVTKLTDMYAYGPYGAPLDLQGTVKFGQDDRHIAIATSQGIDVYQLNRDRNGLMKQKASVTFVRRIQSDVPNPPNVIGGRKDWYLTDDLDVIIARTYGIPNTDESADANEAIEIVSGVSGAILYHELAPWGTPGGYAEQLQLVHWDKRDANNQRFAYTWRFDRIVEPATTNLTILTTYYPLLVRGVGGLRIEAPGGTGQAFLQNTGGSPGPPIDNDTCRMGGVVSVSADGDTILTAHVSFKGVIMGGSTAVPTSPSRATMEVIHCPSQSAVEVGQFRQGPDGPDTTAREQAWISFFDYANHFAVGPTRVLLLREPFPPAPASPYVPYIKDASPVTQDWTAGRWLSTRAVVGGRANPDLNLMLEPSLPVEGKPLFKDFPGGPDVPQVSHVVSGLVAASMEFMTQRPEFPGSYSGGHTAVRVKE